MEKKDSYRNDQHNCRKGSWEFDVIWPCEGASALHVIVGIEQFELKKMATVHILFEQFLKMFPEHTSRKISCYLKFLSLKVSAVILLRRNHVSELNFST